MEFLREDIDGLAVSHKFAKINLRRGDTPNDVGSA